MKADRKRAAIALANEGGHNLAAEVLKRRDAETLRRAAEKLEVDTTWISSESVSRTLRSMIEELEKEAA